MTTSHNSWRDWMKIQYALATHNELVKYITHNKEACTTNVTTEFPKVIDAISNNFHHGITHDNRYMEYPL